jgi:hypothetical protein
VELRAFLIKSGQPPCASSGWLHLLHPHAYMCHPPPHKVPLLALSPSCEKSGGEAGLLKGADVFSVSSLPRVSRTMSPGASGAGSSITGQGKFGGGGGGGRSSKHGSRLAHFADVGASGLESPTNTKTRSLTALWSEHLFYVSGRKLFYLIGDPLTVRARSVRVSKRKRERPRVTDSCSCERERERARAREDGRETE